jgi:RNA polymerase sigma factor (sigma-70 family)
MLGSTEEAEDAVQHTFLAAYDDMVGSDKEIHLRAWLFTIARNRCYSMLRARREQVSDQFIEPVTEGLATQVQRRQDLRDLVTDLGRLPDDQRAALVLAEMEALSHAQIGAVLGVPREKVKALVFQARESLLAARTARETDCRVIREQLSTMRGGALRRSNLRRHLRECSGCRDFRREVERQRRSLALILPVAPTLALKDSILAATVGGAGVGAVGAGGGLIAGGILKGATAKSLVAAAVAGAGTAGTIVAADDLHLLPDGPGQASYYSSPKARGPITGVRSSSRAAASALGAGSASSSPLTAMTIHSAGLGPLAPTGRRSGSAGLSILNPLSLAPSSVSRAPGRGGSQPGKPAPSPAPTPAAPSGAGAGSSTSPYLGTSAYGTGVHKPSGGRRGAGSSTPTVHKTHGASNAPALSTAGGGSRSPGGGSRGSGSRPTASRTTGGTNVSSPTAGGSPSTTPALGGGGTGGTPTTGSAGGGRGGGPGPGTAPGSSGGSGGRGTTGTTPSPGTTGP